MNEEADNEKGKKYALWLGDVVILGKGEDGSNLVLTAAAKRRPRAISLYIEEEEDEEEQTKEVDENDEGGAPKKRKTDDPLRNGNRNGLAKGDDNDSDGVRGHRRAILDQKTRVSLLNSSYCTYYAIVDKLLT